MLERREDERIWCHYPVKSREITIWQLNANRSRLLVMIEEAACEVSGNWAAAGVRGIKPLCDRGAYIYTDRLSASSCNCLLTGQVAKDQFSSWNLYVESLMMEIEWSQLRYGTRVSGTSISAEFSKGGSAVLAIYFIGGVARQGKRYKKTCRRHCWRLL